MADLCQPWLIKQLLIIRKVGIVGNLSLNFSVFPSARQQDQLLHGDPVRRTRSSAFPETLGPSPEPQLLRKRDVLPERRLLRVGEERADRDAIASPGVLGARVG